MAFNPVPMAAFFDAFVIGDGEEAILELADAHIRWKESGGSREELLRSWHEIPGIYVPSLHRPGEKVLKRITRDLNQTAFPTQLVVPFCEIVHDRIGIEIARGCTRGCRFCQAGMLYRPVREREPDKILELAKQNIAAAGWKKSHFFLCLPAITRQSGTSWAKWCAILGAKRLLFPFPP